MPSRILILDDHPITCRGLAEYLAMKGAFEVISAVPDPSQALALLTTQKIDVLLLDYALPPTNAPAFLDEVQRMGLCVENLIYSAYCRPAYLRAALKAGTKGYLIKGTDLPLLATALSLVAAGGTFFSPSVMPVLDKIERLSTLTPREEDTLCALAQGMDNTALATHLGIGQRTVRHHLAQIYGKVGVQNAREAIVWAFQHGLAEAD